MDYLHSIRVFQCVIDEGSFAAAARKMDLSPAMVTRQIKYLEDTLGARLLNRTTRGMALTNAGEGYLQRLRPILCELEDAADQARAHSSDITGNLRVSSTSLVAVNLLAPCVTDFQKLHAAVQVEIHTTDHPGQALKQHDLSILKHDEHFNADVVVRPVLDMNYVLCASVGYLQQHGVPKTPEELAKHRMVRLRPPGSRLQAVGLVNPAERDRTVELSCAWSVISNDDETAYQAALSGAGLTLLPELALNGRPHGGQLRRVMAPWVSVDRLRLVATLPSRHFVPQRTRAFLEFFIQHVQRAANGAANGAANRAANGTAMGAAMGAAMVPQPLLAEGWAP